MYTLQEILAKLEGFDVKKVDINGREIKLQIKIKNATNVAHQEEMIKKLLPEHVLKITFFIEEKKQKFKKIFGVTSGKGGVGKSTVALHLALELKERGFKVGLLDADLYSPSIPVFLNINQVPNSTDGKMIDPILTHGLQLLSMGLFLSQNQAPLWRPNMLGAAFRQFLEQGNWDCDYLVIDFPPGTNDLYNACSTLIPEIQFLLIGEPNKVVYADVMRLYIVLKGLNLNILGLVNNKAYSICENCRHRNTRSAEFDLKDLKKNYELPELLHLLELGNSGYPQDYKQNLEKKYFEELVNLIL